MRTRRTNAKRRPINHKNWWQGTTAGRPVFEFTADEIRRTIERIRTEKNIPLNLVRCDEGIDRWYLSLGKQNALTKGEQISPIGHAFELRTWLAAFTVGFDQGTNAARELARKGWAI